VIGWRLTQPAADDIAAIFLYGIEQFGIDQADAYHAGLEAAFDFLARYPRAARERSELSPPVRVHPYRAHLIVYEVEQNGGVFVLRVRHGRENWTADQE